MNGLQLKDAPARILKPEMPIDPRILARWVSVRQDQTKRRWRRAKIALGVVTALVGVWLIAQSPLLVVRNVAVVGGSHTTRHDVLAAAGLDHRRPMFSVDAGQVKHKVATLPWVGAVVVERHWPSGLTIRITERQPRAQMAGPAGQTVVTDDQGRVLAVQGDVVDGALDGLGGGPALVRIVGGAPAGAPGTSVRATAGGALALVRALSSPGSDRRLTVVTEAPDATLRATLSPGPIEVVFGSVDDIGAKLVAARSLMAGLAPGTSATLDVRVVDAPVLTNEKNSSMVSTTQRG